MILCAGEGFFRRFKAENTNVHFLHCNDEDKYKYDDISLAEWSFDNDRYIRENNNGALCESTESIFIVECGELIWKGEKDLSFLVVVNNSNFCGYLLDKFKLIVQIQIQCYLEKLSVSFQIPYNAAGQIIQPIVVHKGEIVEKVSDYFKSRIVCLGTQDGDLNFNVIGAVLQRVQA